MEEAPRECTAQSGIAREWETVKNSRREWQIPQKKIPPHNAFRHSFASYHVAWKRDFQDTALIMSHKGTDILFKHYRGITTKEDAERYFNIYPQKTL